MVILVIGANCTGKSHFIENRFQNGAYSILNVYDYQEPVGSEKDLSKWEQLYRANERLNADIAGLVRQGKDVVVEQTFLRALRRIACVDAIREVSEDVPIEVYAMAPSDEQLRHNCAERAGKTSQDAQASYQSIKSILTETWEFPNPAEGYSKVYEVSGGEITERKDKPDWEAVRHAREELARDAEKRCAEQAARDRHEELVQKAGSVRFWHYCESCGKKELLTADEAFNQGWDYPPRMYKFRMLSPRTCGNCLITSTLY